MGDVVDTFPRTRTEEGEGLKVFRKRNKHIYTLYNMYLLSSRIEAALFLVTTLESLKIKRSLPWYCTCLTFGCRGLDKDSRTLRRLSSIFNFLLTFSPTLAKTEDKTILKERPRSCSIAGLWMCQLYPSGRGVAADIRRKVKPVGRGCGKLY